MFEGISEKLNSTLKKVRGYGKLSDKNIEEALREVRLSLLEADVNFKVVKEFLTNLKEKALGEEVLESLTPAQQVIKIVNDEMIRMLGSTGGSINFASKGPTIIMMVGLQGTGKTSSVIKLANFLNKKQIGRASCRERV